MDGQIWIFSIGLGLLAAILLFFTSCQPLEVGLFYSLEKEKPLADKDPNLPNNISTVGISQISEAGEQTLFIGGINLFRRRLEPTDTQAQTWSKILSPSGYDLILDMTRYNNTLYVLYSAGEGGDTALFSYSTTNTDSNKLTKVSTGLTETQRVESIFTTEDDSFAVFFASVRNTASNVPEYALYYADTADTDDLALTETSLNNLPVQISEIAYDGSRYFLFCGNRLYAGTPAGGFTSVEDALPDTYTHSDAIGALTYDDTSDTLYVAGDNGYVYASTDGGTNWISSSQVVDSDNKPLPLVSVNSVPVSRLDSSQKALITGVESRGYVEHLYTSGEKVGDGFVLSEPTEGGTAGINYSNITLSSLTIKEFYVPLSSSTNIFYALTMQGLWINENGTWALE